MIRGPENALHRHKDEARLEIADRNLTQMMKFAVVGGINTALDIAVFSALVYLFDWDVIVSNTLGFCAGVINSYVLNARWTFKNRRIEAGPLANLGTFFVVSIVGLGISNLTIWLLATNLGPIGAKLIAVVASFAWNFTASRRFVFSDKS